MSTIRYPAAAGMFYPAEPEKLRSTVQTFLQDAKAHADLAVPKAIIAPHAGYIYSGPVAASAYACLHQVKNKIFRVVLLAPAHRYPVRGIVTTNFDAFATPLGNIGVDHEAIDKIVTSAHATIVEEAYNLEHALEVHLPFLQILLENFLLVPLLVGDTEIAKVVALLNELWDGEETLIIVSSDLSHFYDYETAKAIDQKTADAILALNPKAIAHDHACGYVSIKGLLTVASEKSLKASLVDLRNSGDTAGTKDSVVGYGAFHFVK